MPRTLAIFALAAVLIASAWLRLEEPRWTDEALLMIGLALIPTLAVALRRRARIVALAGVAATVLAAGAAFDVPITDARPGDRDTDFLDPVLASFKQGSLEFFDTRVPFDPVDFPLMHGIVLVAIFGFVAATGIALAARRALTASAALVTGVIWPATISSSWGSGTRPLVTGALTLASVLVILFLLRDGARPARGFWHAAAAGALLIVVSVGASTSDAVAKGGFVQWEDWDLYDPPQKPVGVSYVWNSNYEGIKFPPKKTVVLRVRVPGPKRSLYWRATTLDEYTGTAWHESLEFSPGSLQAAEEIELVGRDPLLPDKASDSDKWVRQDVKVEALRDDHLIGSAQPVQWRPGTSAPVQVAESGIVKIPQQLRQGQRYTVWSYVPEAKPSQLAKASTTYSPILSRYLAVGDIELPAYGQPGRDAEMRKILAGDVYIGESHGAVYEVAQQVVRNAESPYDVAVALEAWFRSDGDFVYDETPPPYGVEPPLVTFIREHKRGYCQQFAGGMAMMLRLLGIPARVAAGFTSGEYNDDKREWTVTDHNAHTWVEVYFPGFGWIPFDPTPNRGSLTAPYSVFSPAFNARDALGALAGAATLDSVRRQLDRSQQESEGGFRPDVPGDTAAAEDQTGAGIIGLALLLLAGGTAVLLVVKALRRALRFATRDPRRLAAACRRDLVGFLADQRIDAPVSATLTELGEFVEAQFAVNAAPFVRAAAVARFGRPGETRDAMRRARRELKILRAGIRRQLSAPERVRGAVSVRSLAV